MAFWDVDQEWTDEAARRLTSTLDVRAFVTAAAYRFEFTRLSGLARCRRAFDGLAGRAEILDVLVWDQYTLRDIVYRHLPPARWAALLADPPTRHLSLLKNVLSAQGVMHFLDLETPADSQG